MRVVIADDSSVLRERLTAALSEIRGVEVVGEAENSREAVYAIRKLKPDLVLLDIRMPGGSGIDVLKVVRRNRKDGASPKIIVFTSYPYPQYRKQCLKLGADFFFDKSSDFKDMLDVIKNEAARINGS